MKIDFNILYCVFTINLFIYIQIYLAKHKMTHLNPSERQEYRCSFCHIIFETVTKRMHHEELHKDSDNFTCSECNQLFKNEKNLAYHIRRNHTNEKSKSRKPPPKKHPCHLCKPTKMFGLTKLRMHLAKNHSTNFKVVIEFILCIKL